MTTPWKVLLIVLQVLFPAALGAQVYDLPSGYTGARDVVDKFLTADDRTYRDVDPLVAIREE